MTDVTGSVTTAGGSGQQFNTNEEGKTTPRKFTVDKDARSMESGGTYPNYWSHKTRSGHSFIMDDSEGNETVTLQHRSGTAIQMRPDGGMLLTTHNGKYEVVLGEERVTISGASDITVKGDTSLRCYGDYNVTVHKDYNLTVLGNMNMTSKNLNRHIRGTMDTETKTENKRIEGSSSQNNGGAHALVTKGDFSIATKGKFQAVSGKDFGIHAKGNMVAESDKKLYHRSGDEYHGSFFTGSTGGQGAGRKYGSLPSGSGIPKKSILVNSEGTHYRVTGEYNIDVGQSMSRKIGMSDSHDVGQNKKVRVQGHSGHTTVTGNIIQKATAGSIQHTATAGSVDIRAPAGAATVAGGITNINSITGVLNMAAAAGGINLESIGGLLNLNGGIITQIASALGLSLPFDITSAMSADKPPELQGIQADQPKEEPDASGEINSWQ